MMTVWLTQTIKLWMVWGEVPSSGMLHGITRGPDGRLYFRLATLSFRRGREWQSAQEASSSGAVFRCDSNGSNFEVYALACVTRRNWLLIIMNLFTFDNTGDIGDKPAVVYLGQFRFRVDMAHQSPHHYANALDWGDFYVPKSVWVGQKMFETYDKDQPQWVYPPIAHVGNGPSGVTWLSGMSVPEDLRDTFALTDYRGAAKNSVTHAIKLSSPADFKVSKSNPSCRAWRHPTPSRLRRQPLFRGLRGRLVREQERFHSSSPSHGS